MVSVKDRNECPYLEELKTLRRGLIWSLLLLIVMSLYLTLLSLGYKIEVELGDSLNPIIGKYAVLLVQENPSEVYKGDIVTVVCAGDWGVITIRKVVMEVGCYLIDMENELMGDYVRIVSPTTDHGWFPVSNVRAKVVKILFRGLVKPPDQPPLFSPKEIAPKWVK